ncbi:ABC transporter permease [Aeromicrobium fastidiosum]|uniref:Transport permease protein n=1 Tax=Aeromicrobium fastidiosum TaxID=52699 RepID=A0A641ARU9_9ACTN|nr:ABC transporter permease [Aeromicrobium fastidiosum]KAA1380247.1 ABC transporter permease [Aeromicrobium fastidiosum]MBP2389798.1 ABC-2 type transport system permease protein [Aeromicrobium fastidiosum]
MTTDAGQRMDTKVAAALGTGVRPAPASPIASSLTFGWRALLKIKHVPEQLFDVTMFPIMFTLMFTFIFGGAIAGSPQDYLPYLAPGILVQTVVMITMYTAMTINNDIEKGVFDRIRSLPVWRPSLLVGSLLGDTLRYSMASTIIIAMTLLLGYRPAGGVTGVVAAVALLLIFCFSLSWIWTLLGFKLRTPNAVMGVSMMVLFPLTFLSNVFVSPDTMPDVLRSVVNVNPVTILVDAARSLMDGRADGGAIVTVLIMSAVLVAVFGPLTMRVFANKS